MYSQNIITQKWSEVITNVHNEELKKRDVSEPNFNYTYSL